MDADTLANVLRNDPALHRVSHLIIGREREGWWSLTVSYAPCAGVCRKCAVTERNGGVFLAHSPTRGGPKRGVTTPFRTRTYPCV